MEAESGKKGFPFFLMHFAGEEMEIAREGHDPQRGGLWPRAQCLAHRWKRQVRKGGWTIGTLKDPEET